MRPYLFVPLFCLAAASPTLAQTFNLPNGVPETFGEEWIVETPLQAPDQPNFRARWRTGDGPDVRFQKVASKDAEALNDEQRWLPIVLADEGLKVREVQEVNSPLLGATKVRRYICEDGQKRQVIVETGSQPTDSGTFRMMIRHPEKMEAKPAEVTAALKAKYFVRSEPRSFSVPGVVQFSSAPGETSGDFVQAHRSAMVIVADEAGGGSGFVCELHGKPMLVTNIHVAASSPKLRFTNLNREAVTPGNAYAAVGRDILALETAKVPGTLEVHPAVDEVKVGDAVFVLGNSNAGGVVHPVEGKVVGMGPELVEVDAPFVPGNSGSPVIHKATGKVIGVATYLTIQPDEFGASGQREVIRRYAYRLDGIKSWQPVEWKTFYGEQIRAHTVRELTESLARFIRDIAEDGSLNPGLHQNPAIRTYVQEWEKVHRVGLSEADAKRANTQLARFMKSASVNDINEAVKTMKYDYFVRQVKQDALAREKITKLFERLGRDY